MKKKKLYKRIEQLNIRLAKCQKILNARIQIIAKLPTTGETLLMNVTLESFYLARLYGGYTDAVPDQVQWIAGPVRIALIP